MVQADIAPAMKTYSLVVPTYNRPEFIRRLLGYYSTVDGLPILIGDGSTPEFRERNRAVIETFRGRGMQITHYVPTLPPEMRPGLEAPYGYAERIVACARMATTPYVQTLADDDFCAPEFLDEAASFLDRHPDYSVATGYNCAFTLDRQEPHGRVTNWDLPPMQSASRREDTASSRIAKLEFGPRVSLDWAMQRRENWEPIGAAMMAAVNAALDPTDPTDPKTTTFTLYYLFGLMADHGGLALGKLHWLPRVQMARHFHLENTGRMVREQFRRNLGDTIVSPNWPRLARIFVDMITALLVQKQGLAEPAARRVAEGGLCLRIGQRLAHVGQQRFAENAVDLTDERNSQGQLRTNLRKIPALRQIVQSVRKRYQSASGTRLDSIPELVSLQHFLEDAR
jgi:glycosyltransferase domain-containing protein